MLVNVAPSGSGGLLGVKLKAQSLVDATMTSFCPSICAGPEPPPPFDADSINDFAAAKKAARESNFQRASVQILLILVGNRLNR